MSILIGFSGKKQHGKNTCCNFIKEQYPSTKILSLANPIREIGKVFGFTDNEMYVDKESKNKIWNISWRKFAQLVGTDFFRKQFNDDVWIKILEANYLKYKDVYDFILIDDVRFENEVYFVHKYNGYVINVLRPNMLSDDNHESEKSIENWDFRMINDASLKDLRENVLITIEDIIMDSQL